METFHQLCYQNTDVNYCIPAPQIHIVFKSEFESIVPEYNLDTCDEEGDTLLIPWNVF